MKKILLSQGKVAVVDDEDFEHINQFNWCYSNQGYAVRHEQGHHQGLLLMHRIILPPPDEMEIDHINHNGLDNQKNNLRICTRSQNLQNRFIFKNNSSGYKGIYPDRNKWRVQIRINKIKINLGSFSSPHEAALAYDKAAKELFGVFAKTNF